MKFKENFHMNHNDFKTLFDLLEKDLVPIKITRNDTIEAEVKLCSVLE